MLLTCFNTKPGEGEKNAITASVVWCWKTSQNSHCLPRLDRNEAYAQHNFQSLVNGSAWLSVHVFPWGGSSSWLKENKRIFAGARLLLFFPRCNLHKGRTVPRHPSPGLWRNEAGLGKCLATIFIFPCNLYSFSNKFLAMGLSVGFASLGAGSQQVNPLMTSSHAMCGATLWMEDMAKYHGPTFFFCYNFWWNRNNSAQFASLHSAQNYTSIDM